MLISSFGWILARRFPIVVALAVLAFGQTEGDKLAANFCAKYGPPINRETFIIPAGEMVVDYSRDRHMCRIQLPPIAPDNRHPGMKSAKAMDEFILELVPLTSRGRELGRYAMATGAPSVSAIEYEHVVISEMFQGEMRTGMTIKFKAEKCEDRSSQ